MRKREFIVDERRGRKTAVVLPIEEYERLLEDLHDLAVLAERRDEESVPLEEVEKKLKADGLIVKIRVKIPLEGKSALH